MLATLAGFFTVSPLDCLRQRDTKESRKTIANRIHVMDVNFSAEAPHCLLSSSFTAAPLGGSELGRLWQRTKQFYCDKGGFLAPRLLGALISGPITRLPPLGGKAPQIGSVCRPAGESGRAETETGRRWAAFKCRMQPALPLTTSALIGPVLCRHLADRFTARLAGSVERRLTGDECSPSDPCLRRAE